MTRKEEIVQAAKQSIKGDSFEDGCIGRGYFIIGAEWADRTAWKPANGDNLPEIDREVIALVEENGHFKVVFAHRPPEYWDGRNILTNEVTRNYTKRYGKGDWNQPNVKWWLDSNIEKLINNEEDNKR